MPKELDKGIESTGVTDGNYHCEPLNVSAENQTWVLCKDSKNSYLLPALQHCHAAILKLRHSNIESEDR